MLWHSSQVPAFIVAEEVGCVGAALEPPYRSTTLPCSRKSFLPNLEKT